MSTIVNPNAAVTIGLEGLAISCFNQSYNKNQGRWEVAFPRFDDHTLEIIIDGLGTILVDETVKFIEIKDRVGVPANPKHEIEEAFDRKDNGNNKNDFRWLVDFTNGTELPHGQVSVITKKDNPDRVDITMMYVYDATFYVKNLVSNSLIRSEQSVTAPVVNGIFSMLPDIAGTTLDRAGKFGFEAKTMGIDIESAEGSSIDIVFDGTITITIPRKDTVQEVKIKNLEPITASTAGRFVQSAKFEYGLGDLFRYYELLRVDGPKFHLWAKSNLILLDSKSGSIPPASNRTTDCGGVRVNLANLDSLL